MNKRVFIGFSTLFLMFFAQGIKTQNVDSYAKANRYYIDAKIDSALVCLDMRLSEIDSTDYEPMAETLLFRSRVLGNLAFFEPAMENAMKAYDLSKTHHMDNLTAASLLAVGKVYYLMYNDSVAEDYMLRAHTLAQDKHCDKELMATKSALAQLYSALERNDECLAMATQSLEMAEQLQDTLQMIENLSLFGAYYINLNQRANPVVAEHQLKVKQYLDEALQLAVTKNIPMLIQNVYAHYIRYYRLEKDYTEALNYANKVIEISQPAHYSMLIQVYDHLVGIYAHLGNEEMVINSHRQFYSLMRRQSDYNLHRSLQEIQVKYNVQEKELEIARQQSEIKQTVLQRRMLSLAVLFALMLSGMFYYMYFIRRRRNKELHLINASKDKLFSIISHDLKSPVAAQKMAAENLLENFDAYDKPLLLKNLRNFHQAAEAQSELLQNLFNWAQMQTGQMQYHPTRFNLSELAKEVSDIYRLPAQNKNVDIRMDVAEDCTALADRSMIHAVLRNLMNNAVKFSHPDSEIILSITCNNGKARVSVKDNGVGMTAEQVNALSDASKQKRSTTGTVGEKGSGLGLIICREMLERNDSKLIIHSSENVGTEIEFYLTV